MKKIFTIIVSLFWAPLLFADDDIGVFEMILESRESFFATTQALVSLLDERSKATAERNPTVLELPTMFQVARMVGATLKEVIEESQPDGQESSAKFRASVILGGQIKGCKPTLFLIYPEGNFIEITDDTPFFQIGETKYGKPILVRAYDS